LDCRLEPSLPRLARGTASIEVTGGRALPPLADDPERRAVKTAADRAAEAIEAAGNNVC
jgi:hypothetical protein